MCERVGNRLITNVCVANLLACYPPADKEGASIMTISGTRKPTPTIKELDAILDDAGWLVDAYLATDAEARELARRHGFAYDTRLQQALQRSREELAAFSRRGGCTEKSQ